MATALLVGTNVNAVEVATFEALQDAIANAAAGTPTSITLTADIPATAAININGGRIIEINLNNQQITSDYRIVVDNGQLTLKGQGSIISTTIPIDMRGSYEDVANYSVVNIEKDVRVVTSSAYGICLFQNSKNDEKGKPSHGYGLVLNLDGYVQASQAAQATAIWILGNIQQKSVNIPQVNLGPNAVVVASNDGVGLYGGGYANYDIKGNVSGGSGIYAKAGVYEISDNAVITGTATSYVAPVANGDGFTGGLGCGIVSDSKNGYAGGMEITIKGNATIQTNTTDGYSLLEAKTDATKSKTESLVISGGTINGNLSTTAELKENVKVNGTITGGTFTEDITEYLNNISGVITPTLDENGKTIYVIDNKPTTDPWLTSFEGATATSYVRLTGGGDITLANSVEVAYLVMQGDANKVIIGDGKVLTVGEIVLGPNAVIDVRGGGKLVVKGTNGIVANANSNIIIAAQEGSMGQFYLDPTVASNKNPHATVALTTKSYWNGDDYAYERMGVPAVDGMAIQDIVNVGGAPNVSGLYWDANANPQGWKQAPKTQVLAPFTGIALISTSTTPGKQYNFPCRLVGNSDVPLSVVGQWTYFANSYMAELDLKALGTAILASGENVAATAFTDPEGKENWGSVSLESLKEGMFADRRFLKPMQGFILNNNSANPTTANVTVNYCAMVWDPVYNPTHQHKAARMSSDLIRAMITVTAENGREDAIIVRQSEEFSPAYDNGADVAQYMGLNAFDFYATTELGNMTEVASNDIDGLQLSVAAKEAGSYKMTFSYVLGEQLAIRDNLTGTTMTIAEGAEYYFSATEGTSNNRFEIVSVKNAPTDVETVVETEGAKAVYTVLGQYVGTTDNWSILPAGIYVIDGVKMVK